MKFLIFLLIVCNTQAFAWSKKHKSICLPKITSSCLKEAKQLLLEQDKSSDDLIQNLVSHYGMSVLFMSFDRGEKSIIQLLPFVGKMEKFKSFYSHPKFFESIPNDVNFYDLFLDVFISSKNFKNISQDELSLFFLLFNPSKENLEYHQWENPEYPFKYSKAFMDYSNNLLSLPEIQNDEDLKEKVKSIKNKLINLEKFANSICSLKKVEDYQEAQEIYGDFHHIKGESGGFISCLIKNKSYDLLVHILDSDKLSFDHYKMIIDKFINYHSSESKEILSKVFGAIIQSNYVEDFFETQILKKYHANIKDFNSCMQLDISSKQKNLELLIQQCDDALFEEIEAKIELAISDYKNEGKTWMVYLDEIITIYKEGFDLNFKNNQHEHLLHILVNANIRDMVVYIEQNLNSKNKHFDYTAKNDEGKTVLHLAIQNQNLKLIDDYSKKEENRDLSRFPFMGYSKIKNISNGYNEDNKKLIQRIPASLKKERIWRDEIVKRLK